MTDRRPASYFGTARTEITPLLPGFSARVLEVGCGSGATLGYLKATGRAGWTCGIELDGEAAREAAGRADEIHPGDVERMALPVAAGSIDLLLALDVLEHLVDPWAVLARLATVVRPGGHVIASIPNVRHLSAVAPLVLAGRWDYRVSGVLDRTHLRFFTRRSAIELIEGAGFTLEAERTTGWSRKTRLASWLSLGLARPLLTLQYLLRARRQRQSFD